MLLFTFWGKNYSINNKCTEHNISQMPIYIYSSFVNPISLFLVLSKNFTEHVIVFLEMIVVLFLIMILILRVTVVFLNLNHFMRKPAICICENKGADQLRSNCKADQHLCFCYMDSTIPLLSRF